MSPPQELGPHLLKFARELGTVTDFVTHLSTVEQAHRGNALATMQDSRVTNFFATAGGARYLLVTTGPTRVVDFRHFFAAAAETYCAGKSRQRLWTPSSDSTLLLGLGNEVAQCIQESSATVSDSLKQREAVSRMNSCFSAEDLGSNRLGAEFAREIRILESTRRLSTCSAALRLYLARLHPAADSELAHITTPTSTLVAYEALVAVLSGIRGLFISEAY